MQLNILQYKFIESGIKSIYLFSKELQTDKYYIFSSCSELKQLNLSSFNTNQITDISYMFFLFRIKRIIFIII